MKYVTKLLSMIGICFLIATSSFAQTAVSFGEYYIETFASAGEVDEFTFEITDTLGFIIVNMSEADDANLNPKITVFSPSNTQLISFSKSPSVQAFFAASEIGTYRVEAEDNNGTYTGDYGFMVQKSFEPGNSESLSFGVSKTDSISMLGTIKAYTFEMEEAPSNFYVSMQELGDESFSPAIRVFDPQGSEVFYDSGLKNANDIGYAAVVGTYTVWADDNGGDDLNGFSINVQNSYAPGNATDLMFGETYRDSTRYLGELSSYTFQVNDALGSGFIIANSDSSFIESYVFDPVGGRLVETETDFREGQFFNFTMVGNYTVWTKDVVGDHLGAFSIAVQKTYLPANPDTLTLGTVINDSLNQEQLLQTFQLHIPVDNGSIVLQSVGCDLEDDCGNYNNEMTVFNPAGGQLSGERGIYAVADSGLYTIIGKRPRFIEEDVTTQILVQSTINPVQATKFAIGELVEPDSLLSNNLIDTYTFDIDEVTGSAALLMSLEGEQEDNNSQYYLYNPAGEQVASGNVSGIDGRNFPVTEVGEYTLCVRGHLNIVKGYKIFIQKAINPTSATLVPIGELVESTIPEVGKIEAYQFKVSEAKGDIWVNVSSLDNPDFGQTFIRVYDPNGEELFYRRNNTAGIGSFAVADTGNYVILVNAEFDTTAIAPVGVFVQQTYQPAGAILADSIKSKKDSLIYAGAMHTYSLSGSGHEVKLSVFPILDSLGLGIEMFLYDDNGEYVSEGYSVAGFEKNIQDTLRNGIQYTLIVKEYPIGYDPEFDEEGRYSAKVHYQLRIDHQVGVANEGEDVNTIPAVFALDQNYPNPFNPVTNITYQLPDAVSVTIQVYNILGQQIKTLVDKRQPAGHYTVQWNSLNNLGNSVPSGVYFYRINASEFTKSIKMVLLK